MTDQEYFEAFDAQAQRRAGRRAFFKATLVGAAAASAATAGSFLTATAAEAQAVTDTDILNFALNLEYLEANFYYYAAYGIPIPVTSTPGVGTAYPAVPTTGANGVVYNAGARAVKFVDPSIQAYATEIANEEFAHVNFLRTALGSAAVAQPLIDVGNDPNGAFSSFARAAGVIGATTAANPTSFDPYASDTAFLYGAFGFEDVGVTAYKGASPLLSNPVYLDAAAGILAAEAYHASIVRLTLDQLSVNVSGNTIVSDIGKLSAARDSVDGNTTSAATAANPITLYANDDQGIARTTTAVGLTANIVPTDPNGLAFSRPAGQVLNIVYLNTSGKAATGGGFFPNGTNGTIKTSTANS